MGRWLNWLLYNHSLLDVSCSKNINHLKSQAGDHDRGTTQQSLQPRAPKSGACLVPAVSNSSPISVVALTNTQRANESYVYVLPSATASNPMQGSCLFKSGPPSLLIMLQSAGTGLNNPAERGNAIIHRLLAHFRKEIGVNPRVTIACPNPSVRQPVATGRCSKTLNGRMALVPSGPTPVISGHWANKILKLALNQHFVETACLVISQLTEPFRAEFKVPSGSNVGSSLKPRFPT